MFNYILHFAVIHAALCQFPCVWNQVFVADILDTPAAEQSCVPKIKFFASFLQK